MTIPLTGAGGAFTRLGHLFGALADANALRGGAATARVLSGANLAARVNTIEADYAAGTAVQQLLDGIFGNLTSVQGGLSSLFSDYTTRAQNTLKAMYSIDQGVGATAPASVLTASDLTTALRTLISQMTTAAASVNASVPAVGAQTAVGTPQGNPVFVFGVKNPQGQTLQYLFAEALTALATTDSQSGGTLGNEGYSVRGQVAVSDVWSPLWPGGSGASYSGNLVDGSKSNSTGNRLTNSDFTAFVGNPNLPDNWVALVGTPGTDIFNGTAGGPTPPGAAPSSSPARPARPSTRWPSPSTPRPAPRPAPAAPPPPSARTPSTRATCGSRPAPRRPRGWRSSPSWTAPTRWSTTTRPWPTSPRAR
jgi:hypothetical protein